MSAEPAQLPPRYSSYTLVLPAYDEAARIARAIRYYRAFAPILVVDNFSTDATADIARSLGAKVVQHRNAGTCQTPEWFRHVAALLETDHFALLSCSEFIPPAVLGQYDEVAREGSAGVVACTRRSYTCGELIPRLWDDGEVERFFDRRELDYDAIVIHGNFSPLRPERRLRLPTDERYVIAHLRDFDAESLMRKATDYAVVEARDRVRMGRPIGLRWLMAQWTTEAYRFLRIPPRRWSRVALREIWARVVMHSIVWWMGWELRAGRTIDDSRARSSRLWEEIVLAGERSSSPGVRSRHANLAVPLIRDR